MYIFKKIKQHKVATALVILPFLVVLPYFFIGQNQFALVSIAVNPFPYFILSFIGDSITTTFVYLYIIVSIILNLSLVSIVNIIRNSALKPERKRSLLATIAVLIIGPYCFFILSIIGIIGG